MECANSLSFLLGVPLTADLGRYLGVPITHGRPTKRTYAYLVDKLRSKLAAWKRNIRNVYDANNSVFRPFTSFILMSCT